MIFFWRFNFVSSSVLDDLLGDVYLVRISPVFLGELLGYHLVSYLNAY